MIKWFWYSLYRQEAWYYEQAVWQQRQRASWLHGLLWWALKLLDLWRPWIWDTDQGSKLGARSTHPYSKTKHFFETDLALSNTGSGSCCCCYYCSVPQLNTPRVTQYVYPYITCTSTCTVHRVRGLRVRPFSVTPPCRQPHSVFKRIWSPFPCGAGCVGKM